MIHFLFPKKKGELIFCRPFFALHNNCTNKHVTSVEHVWKFFGNNHFGPFSHLGIDSKTASLKTKLMKYVRWAICKKKFSEATIPVTFRATKIKLCHACDYEKSYRDHNFSLHKDVNHVVAIVNVYCITHVILLKSHEKPQNVLTDDFEISIQWTVPFFRKTIAILPSWTSALDSFKTEASHRFRTWL